MWLNATLGLSELPRPSIVMPLATANDISTGNVLVLIYSGLITVLVQNTQPVSGCERELVRTAPSNVIVLSAAIVGVVADVTVSPEASPRLRL